MVVVRVECTLNLTRWHTTTSFIIITTTTLFLKIHITIVIHANGSSFIRIWQRLSSPRFVFCIFWNNINTTNITRFNPATFFVSVPSYDLHFQCDLSLSFLRLFVWKSRHSGKQTCLQLTWSLIYRSELCQNSHINIPKFYKLTISLPPQMFHIY
jgi:hypothetical protein